MECFDEVLVGDEGRVGWCGVGGVMKVVGCEASLRVRMRRRVRRERNVARCFIVGLSWLVGWFVLADWRGFHL